MFGRARSWIGEVCDQGREGGVRLPIPKETNIFLLHFFALFLDRAYV
jgi:hypothetical protein